ncbi:MAG: hypothetical protein WBZ37_27695 [Mycobacterium sp.]
MPDMRACHRCGRRGKSTRTLSLIEHWWDELEGDFAYYLGVDARDFVRGTRPWAQFLVYADHVANIEGGRTWAAQLSDDRFLPQFKKALEESKANGQKSRPSLAGYSREVDGLFRVATELRLLRAELGKWGSAPPILGPVFPSEKLEDIDREAEVVDLAAAIEAGHRNWREAMKRNA